MNSPTMPRPWPRTRRRGRWPSHGGGAGGDDRGPPGAGLRPPRVWDGPGGDRRRRACDGGLSPVPRGARAPRQRTDGPAA